MSQDITKLNYLSYLSSLASETPKNYDLAKKTMNFFTRIFTIFELGIISQQLGIKDTFWHWEWGPISAQIRSERNTAGRKSTLNSTCSLNMIDYIREK